MQESLGIADVEEVEDWLVKAMGKKLLSGQMDQVKQQVTITKASYRTFGSDDWQFLEQQLAAWKASALTIKIVANWNLPLSIGMHWQHRFLWHLESWKESLDP